MTNTIPDFTKHDSRDYSDYLYGHAKGPAGFLMLLAGLTRAGEEIERQKITRRIIMTREQSAAYIFAEAVAALCELEAMKAENTDRENSGLSLAYTHKDFIHLQSKYLITHNSVIGVFQNVG